MKNNGLISSKTHYIEIRGDERLGSDHAKMWKETFKCSSEGHTEEQLRMLDLRILQEKTPSAGAALWVRLDAVAELSHLSLHRKWLGCQYALALNPL